MWHLAYSNAMCADGPGSRHGHSAVVHNKAMWVYGGMSDLQPRGDFWRWDFGNYYQLLSVTSSCLRKDLEIPMYRTFFSSVECSFA